MKKEFDTQAAYDKILNISRRTKTLQGISQLLDWDQETYMPAGAGPFRGEQLKILAGIIHKERTGKKFAHALEQLIDLKNGDIKIEGLPQEQQSALKEWRKDYKRDTAIPSSFVEEFTKLCSRAQLVWREAKKENAFHLFAPFLDKIVSMSRKKADLLGYADHPYDALLDLHEPDAKTADVEKIFTNITQPIVDLLKKITQGKQPDNAFLHGNFPHEEQIAFGNILLDAMGYDRSKGRLDFSTHPFSTSFHPTDSRITTTIHSTGLLSNISSILHEGGHSLYEMGLPGEHFGSPLGEALSLGMHESQSRWWETRIGLSKPFWKHYLPILKTRFPKQLDKISLEDFYRGINKVSPSFIRVEADEVTYSLHIILRFRLEKALIEGSLNVRDIPEAWNAGMQELLGLTPSDYAEGCLQDIHWSTGAFGYFPTYTLGNLYAAHLFEAFEKKNSDWEQRVEAGELGFIKEWLHENVHRHGRRYSCRELLVNATGKDFTPKAYIAYLTHKYRY